MAFTKSETNPNAAVGGGCVGIGGIKGIDCRAPFYTAEAVNTLVGTCPRVVICEYHRGELNRTAGGEAIPAGYGQADATAPKPKRKPRAASDEELSL